MPGEARPFDMQSGGTSAGSESPIFAGRIEKFLFGSTRELNIPISSAGVSPALRHQTKRGEVQATSGRIVPHISDPF